MAAASPDPKLRQVHWVVDEMVVGGMVAETNMNETSSRSHASEILGLEINIKHILL